MPSGKVHKSLRVDATTAERVRSLMRDGESEAAAYNRVLVAGLDAMEGATEATEGGTDGATDPHGQEVPGGVNDASAGVPEALAALTGQLAVKDEQIRALTELVGQAQTVAKQSQQLHAVAEARALPAEADEDGGNAGGGDGRRRGWLSRRFGRNRGKR